MTFSSENKIRISWFSYLLEIRFIKLKSEKPKKKASNTFDRIIFSFAFNLKTVKMKKLVFFYLIVLLSLKKLVIILKT